MYVKAFFFIALSLLLFSCNNKSGGMKDICTDACKKDIACKLTSSEMRERKDTVLTALRQQVLEKKELTNGYSFKFNGTDSIFDQLAIFIKTERQCCDFFTFNLKVEDEKSAIWLDITGQEGVKDFIKTELEL